MSTRTRRQILDELGALEAHREVLSKELDRREAESSSTARQLAQVTRRFEELAIELSQVASNGTGGVPATPGRAGSIRSGLVNLLDADPSARFTLDQLHPRAEPKPASRASLNSALWDLVKQRRIQKYEDGTYGSACALKLVD